MVPEKGLAEARRGTGECGWAVTVCGGGTHTHALLPLPTWRSPVVQIDPNSPGLPVHHPSGGASSPVQPTPPHPTPQHVRAWGPRASRHRVRAQVAGTSFIPMGFLGGPSLICA